MVATPTAATPGKFAPTAASFVFECSSLTPIVCSWAKTTQAPAPPQSWGTAIPTPPTPPPTAQPSTAAPDATVPGGSPWGGSYTHAPTFQQDDPIVVNGTSYRPFHESNLGCSVNGKLWAYIRNATHVGYQTYPSSDDLSDLLPVYQAYYTNGSFLWNVTCATHSPTSSPTST